MVLDKIIVKFSVDIALFIYASPAVWHFSGFKCPIQSHMGMRLTVLGDVLRRRRKDWLVPR